MAANLEPRGGKKNSPVVLAQDLKRRIHARQLFPGTRLTETDLAQQYGVGRHTVRLALQSLISDGLVDHTQNQGAAVRNILPQDVKDLFVLRLALELGAVHEICSEKLDLRTPRIRAAELADLQVKARVKGAVAVNALAEADLAWHCAVVAAAGSPRLDSAYEKVVDELRFVLSVHRVYDVPAVENEHGALLAPLLAYREAEAAKLLTGHLLDGRDLILSIMSQP